MAEIKISGEQRTEFGKGAARRIRRANKVPAVLYGHGTDPIHIALPGHETMLALKNSNALLSIDVEGTNHLAIVKQAQRDILKGFLEHVDLLIVRKGEKVSVEVPFVLVGDAAPDTLVVAENSSVNLEVEATNIPTEIEVSIAGMQPGSQIVAADLVLPEGAALAVDPELLIVNVTAAPTAADLEAELDPEAAATPETSEAAEAPESE